jgi:hypothetical protein
VKFGRPYIQLMRTGAFEVSEISCQDCETVLGLKMIKAFERSEQWKETSCLLELGLLEEVEVDLEDVFQGYFSRVSLTASERSAGTSESEDSDAGPKTPTLSSGMPVEEVQTSTRKAGVRRRGVDLSEIQPSMKELIPESPAPIDSFAEPSSFSDDEDTPTETSEAPTPDSTPSSQPAPPLSLVHRRVASLEQSSSEAKPVLPRRPSESGISMLNAGAPVQGIVRKAPISILRKAKPPPSQALPPPPSQALPPPPTGDAVLNVVPSTRNLPPIIEAAPVTVPVPTASSTVAFPTAGSSPTLSPTAVAEAAPAIIPAQHVKTGSDLTPAPATEMPPKPAAPREITSVSPSSTAALSPSAAPSPPRVASPPATAVAAASTVVASAIHDRKDAVSENDAARASARQPSLRRLPSRPSFSEQGSVPPSLPAGPRLPVPGAMSRTPSPTPGLPPRGAPVPRAPSPGPASSLSVPEAVPSRAPSPVPSILKQSPAKERSRSVGRSKTLQRKPTIMFDDVPFIEGNIREERVKVAEITRALELAGMIPAEPKQQTVETQLSSAPVVDVKASGEPGLVAPSAPSRSAAVEPTPIPAPAEVPTTGPSESAPVALSEPELMAAIDSALSDLEESMPSPEVNAPTSSVSPPRTKKPLPPMPFPQFPVIPTPDGSQLSQRTRATRRRSRSAPPRPSPTLVAPAPAAPEEVDAPAAPVPRKMSGGEPAPRSGSVAEEPSVKSRLPALKSRASKDKLREADGERRGRIIPRKISLADISRPGSRAASVAEDPRADARTMSVFEDDARPTALSRFGKLTAKKEPHAAPDHGNPAAKEKLTSAVWKTVRVTRLFQKGKAGAPAAQI